MNREDSFCLNSKCYVLKFKHRYLWTFQRRFDFVIRYFFVVFVTWIIRRLRWKFLFRISTNSTFDFSKFFVKFETIERKKFPSFLFSRRIREILIRMTLNLLRFFLLINLLTLSIITRELKIFQKSLKSKSKFDAINVELNLINIWEIDKL